MYMTTSKMKYVCLWLFALGFLAACSDSEDTLSNSIDFSSPYELKDNPDSPVDHERYLIYQEYGVPVFFNDTVGNVVTGKDLQGNDIVKTETIDLNWSFQSHDGKSVKYSYTYYKTDEEKMKALEFARAYLSKASVKMRPFCMLLADTVKQNSTSLSYRDGFRCLLVTHTSSYDEFQRDSVAKQILQSMVLSRVKLNSNLVSRFGEVSNRDKFYGRPWVNDGVNGGLGCVWEIKHEGMYWKPMKLFDEGVAEDYIAFSFKTHVTTVEEFEAERASIIRQIGKYGFICGNTDYRGQLDHVQSPGSISQDLTFYVQTMMNTGRAEFMKRYGESPLVKKKFDILADYIENELLIDLNY